MQAKLENILATEQDTSDILTILNPNKAYGPDGISPKLLKEAAPFITPVLTKIFNLSLSQGIFPDTWKRADVVPIHKNAEEFFTSNYRPISLLNTIAKVFERVVFKCLFNFYETTFLSIYGSQVFSLECLLSSS